MAAANETTVTASVPRFAAIDGLRAWMAWVVVAAHIVQVSAMQDRGPIWHGVQEAGSWAVETFMIISGFAITHLLLERGEPYRAYIVRRFMRLFPVFATCSVIGAGAYAFAAHFGAPDWSRTLLGTVYDSQVRYLPLHALAHLTMLHAMIPDAWLPGAQYVFVPPGWSLSLEWQFYLIAPFVVAASRTRGHALALAVVTMVCLYHQWGDLRWKQPLLILTGAPFFLVGIGTRLIAPRLLAQCRHPAAIAIVTLVVSAWLDLFAVGLWVAVMALLFAPGQLAGRLDRVYVKTARLLLEHRAILFLADRSYATYLLHWSVLLALGALLSAQGFSGAALTLALCLGIPVLLIVQDALHRLIERPGQAIGKRWVGRWVGGRRAPTAANPAGFAVR
ncbi:acyltransferase [soil metagenome]